MISSNNWIRLIAIAACVGVISNTLARSDEAKGATGSAAAERSLRAKAEAGDAKAQMELGVALYSKMLEQPFVGLPEVTKWFNSSERQGYVPAKAYVAFLIAWTPPPPEGRDMPRAIRLAKEGADAGDPMAQHILASFFYLGQGVEKDVGKYMYWLRKAADSGWTRSQTDIATAYFRGTGVEKNFKLAEHYYLLAAERGDLDAQKALGGMYGLGTNGFPKKPTEGFKWASRAAESDDPAAQTLLGVLHCDGVGTKRSVAEGQKLLRRAIAQGQKLADEALKECGRAAR